MRNVLLTGLFLGLLVPVAEAAPEGARLGALIESLASPETSARLDAMAQLGRMGEKAARAVPTLVKMLGDESATVRAHAARTLGQIGPSAKPAVAKLVSLIGDKDAVVRREAVAALGKIGPKPDTVLPLLVEQLEKADPPTRIRALAALADMGEAAVPRLIEALKNEKAAYWACLVLSEIGPKAKAAVPALLETLKDKRPGVRREAILALAAIGASSQDAVAALCKCLDDKINCVPATYALGSIGQVPSDVEARIRANVDSSDPILATVSAWALAKLHPNDEQLQRGAIERLGQRMMDRDPRVRRAAVEAFLDLDPDPEISRPIIKKVMDQADPEVLDAAMNTLAGLGEKVLPRLIEALKHPQVRARAAAIIARIGPPAKDAVPALIEALDDANSETRIEVLLALGAIGSGAEVAVPEVTRALDDPDMNVRYAACCALGKIGGPACSAADELLENLSGVDRVLAVSSAWALARLDPRCPKIAAKAVPVLIKALEESNPLVRLQAAETLKLFGPLAKDAVPALKGALHDTDPQVREAAAEALHAIGG